MLLQGVAGLAKRCCARQHPRSMGKGGGSHEEHVPEELAGFKDEVDHEVRHLHAPPFITLILVSVLQGHCAGLAMMQMLGTHRALPGPGGAGWLPP